jgi:hypothetical protein
MISFITAGGNGYKGQKQSGMEKSGWGYTAFNCSPDIDFWIEYWLRPTVIPTHCWTIMCTISDLPHPSHSRFRLRLTKCTEAGTTNLNRDRKDWRRSIRMLPGISVCLHVSCNLLILVVLKLLDCFTAGNLACTTNILETRIPTLRHGHSWRPCCLGRRQGILSPNSTILDSWAPAVPQAWCSIAAISEFNWELLVAWN